MNQVWVFTGASAGERFDWLSTCYNLTIVILAAICWVLNRREDGYMAQAYPDGSFAAHITGGWLARVSLRFGSPAALFAVVTVVGRRRRRRYLLLRTGLATVVLGLLLVWIGPRRGMSGGSYGGRRDIAEVSLSCGGNL